MTKPRFSLLVAMIGLGAPLFAADLLTIRLVPEEINLSGAHAAQRIMVVGKYSDGLERDLTGQSRISVTNPALARVEDGAQIVAVADGHAEVTAAFQRFHAQSRLRIADSQMRRPFQFARDIGEIFTRRGCNNNTCHGSVKGRGGFKLSADALYPAFEP